MRPHALHRVIAPLHFGDDHVKFIAIKRPPIPHLPARLRIKRRVIKNDLAFLAGSEPLDSLTILDDRQHFTILRPRLPIPLEFPLRQLLVSRIRSLFLCAFPWSASALALFGHRAIKALIIKSNTLVSAGVLNEVSRY